MKKFFTLSLFLLILCLSACKSVQHQEILSSHASQETTSNEEKADIDRNFSLMSFYPKCTNQYLVPPSFAYDEVLISDAKSYTGERAIDSVAINLENLTERELGFFAYDVQADSQYYYWMKPDSSALMRTKKDTLESEVLFCLNPDATMIPRLTLHQEMLIWTELTDQTASPVWMIKKLDCQTQKESQIAKTDYVFGPYIKFKTKNNHLSYVTKGQNQYTIHGLHLVNNTPPKPLLTLEHEPVGLVYDGTYLIWSDSTGAHFWNETTSEKVKITDHDVTDIDLLNRRYIVYMSNFQINVYDHQDTRTGISNFEFR